MAEFDEGATGLRLLNLVLGKGQGMGKAGFSRRLRLRLIAHYPTTPFMYETSCVRQIKDLPSLTRLFKPRTVIIYLFDLCEPVVETTLRYVSPLHSPHLLNKFDSSVRTLPSNQT